MTFDLIPFTKHQPLSLWDAFFELPHLHREGYDFGMGIPMDVRATQDRYVVTAEIPGVDTKDLSITLKDGLLTVKGEKKSEYTKEDDGCYCSERSYGKFTRTVQLPDDVNYESDMKATYTDGVITVEVPKKEMKQIPVKKILIS